MVATFAPLSVGVHTEDGSKRRIPIADDVNATPAIVITTVLSYGDRLVGEKDRADAEKRRR